MTLSLFILAVVTASILGGCLGSFLNVVVWRLPAGMSLVRPGSFCPKCGHPIRFYDNVPVFGWLFLRGKCRDCKAPIAFRYPLIEGICALAAGVIAGLFFFGQRSIPFGIAAWEGIAPALDAFRQYQEGFIYFLPVPPESLLFQGLGMTFLWFGVLYLSFAAGLIEWDQKPIPVSLLIGEAVIALGVWGAAFYRGITRESLIALAAAAVFGVRFGIHSRRSGIFWTLAASLAGPLLASGGVWTVLTAGFAASLWTRLDSSRRKLPNLFLTLAFFVIFLIQIILGRPLGGI